tara:strand:+ start:164 stop:1006 length:843 start_codon:yes stop_codon:yes gene_type:complete
MERNAAYDMEKNRTLRHSTHTASETTSTTSTPRIQLALPSQNPMALLSTPSSSSPLSSAYFAGVHHMTSSPLHASLIDQYTAKTTSWSYELQSKKEKKKEKKNMTKKKMQKKNKNIKTLAKYYPPSINEHKVSLVLTRPIVLMGHHDVAQTKDHRRVVVAELIQPLLNGAEFYVQHGKEPLLCTFSLNQDMSMLTWAAQQQNSGSSGGVGGGIRISQIVSAHRNDLDEKSMELTLSRGDVNNKTSATVVLRLRAMTEEQCITWISGIYYLRSICPEDFFN